MRARWNLIMKNTAFTMKVSISGTETLLRSVISKAILAKPTSSELSLKVLEFNSFKVF